MSENKSNSSHAPVRKAVIPIAGWGTRMFPASKAMPKALFPIIDRDGFCKPIIQIIIEEALSALGPDGKVCIVVQDGQKEPIRKYFSSTANEAYHKKAELRPLIERLQYIGERISFKLQDKQEGFGHAVLCAKEFVGNEPFLVLLGDHVYTTSDPNGRTCAQQLVHSYNTRGLSVTSLDTCVEGELHLNGIVTGKRDTNDQHLYKLERIAEKPSLDFARQNLRVEGLAADRYMCFFGIDLLTPKVFDILQKNYDTGVRTGGELQLRDAMARLREEDGMFGVFMQGGRLDTGIPHEYAHAFSVYDKLAK